MRTKTMWWDDVLLAVNDLPASAVRELAKGPLDDDRDPSPACRVCAALDGIESPLGEWHSGDDGEHTFPALASARCMVIYAVAACLDALTTTWSPDEMPAVYARLSALTGPPDFAFDLENGAGAFAELQRLAAENTKALTSATGELGSSPDCECDSLRAALVARDAERDEFDWLSRAADRAREAAEQERNAAEAELAARDAELAEARREASEWEGQLRLCEEEERYLKTQIDGFIAEGAEVTRLEAERDQAGETCECGHSAANHYYLNTGSRSNVAPCQATIYTEHRPACGMSAGRCKCNRFASATAPLALPDSESLEAEVTRLRAALETNQTDEAKSAETADVRADAESTRANTMSSTDLPFCAKSGRAEPGDTLCDCAPDVCKLAARLLAEEHARCSHPDCIWCQSPPTSTTGELCGDKRCQHPRGWHRNHPGRPCAGACVECACLEFGEHVAAGTDLTEGDLR